MIRACCILLLAAMSACMARDSPPGVPSTPDTIPPQRPVIAVAHYASHHDTVALADLLAALARGEVAVTADLAEPLRTRFALHAAPPVTSVADMLGHDADRISLVPLDSLDKRMKALVIGRRSFFDAPADHPLLLYPEGAAFDVDRLTRYLHTGVTAITRYLGVVLDRRGPDHVLRDLRPWFEGADLVHASNEVSGVEECDYAAMHMRFATEWRDMDLLRQLGVDVVELTGNHNLDMGRTAYEETLQWYATNGMHTYGGGVDIRQAASPLKVNLPDGTRIGFVGYDGTCTAGDACRDRSIGAKRYFEADAQRAIGVLRSDSLVRTVVATVQFREVDSPVPPAYQVGVARKLIDLGADMVVGSQAHEPQHIEFHGEGIIFHGLGNFLFDQLHRAPLRQAFFLECWLLDGRMVQAAPRFTCMEKDLHPRMASAQEARDIASTIMHPPLLRP
jgi:hypothetical protein